MWTITDDLDYVTNLLLSYSFKVVPEKKKVLDDLPQEDILGVTIINKSRQKYLTFSAARDDKWKKHLSSLLVNDDLTYTDIASATGKVPKYSVYDPWLKVLSYKVQSIAMHRRTSLKAMGDELVAKDLNILTKKWCEYSIKQQPLILPMKIDVSKPLVLYVDSSKYMVGFMVYQDANLIYQDNELVPKPKIPLNISYKELMALRVGLSWISQLRRAANGYLSHVTIYTDSKIVVSIMESGRVKALPSSTRSHTDLLRREYAVTKELVDGLSWSIKHIDGVNNPSDRLTRHSLLNFIITNFEKEEEEDDDRPQDPEAYPEAPQHVKAYGPQSPDLHINYAVMMVRPTVSEVNQGILDILKEQPNAVTLQDIKRAQEFDEELPNTNDYVRRDGLLYYRRVQGLPLIYIPLSLRPKLLRLFHDELHGSHSNAKAMEDRLRQVLYWPYLRRDCEYYTTTCSTCQKVKARLDQPLPLRSILPSYPLEIVVMDYLQIEGIQLLVVQDIFSKYLRVNVAEKVDGATTASLLLDYINSYGPMSKILSDNASVFKSPEVRRVLQYYNVQQLHSAAYSPWSHGQIEKANSTILTRLRTLRQQYGNHYHWLSYLPFIVATYNLTKHSATGISPYEVFYGRPASPFLVQGLQSTEHYATAAEYLRRTSDDRAQVQDYVGNNLLRQAGIRQRHYLHAHKLSEMEERQLTVGSLVYWYKGPSRASKLDCKWSGPDRGSDNKKAILCTREQSTTSPD
ncbi:hypothetical protein FOZ63_011327 [Perkinsus olseni]|uniref:Integrase catalytic domain-containing protein n=1 Tax=Perkinsus olseni TaxID=32597 RepID=A0A7J6NCB4_PEROL|nr:hypothetical protein FOZ60_011980 [Perkinsus olseni]KAF4755321.1 hypothetical protein FOZ63_011327 [Perkinsus olseni]